MERIHQLPFNVELAEGILPNEKFIFYLIQDAIYLSDFSRALAMTAVKLPDNQLMQHFIEFAQGAMVAERELHIKYIRSHSSEKRFTTEPTPACFMYTNYILKMASTATVEESVASLLPCFWVYREVGKHIAASCKNDHHPYGEWISLYASEQFDTSVQTAISTVNKLGATVYDNAKENMIKAFLRSTKLEWLFWDSAYHQEKWLI